MTPGETIGLIVLLLTVAGAVLRASLWVTKAINDSSIRQDEKLDRVIESLDKLTRAVDHHGAILQDHDARLSRVEQGR
jgi:hypothetical protein